MGTAFTENSRPTQAPRREPVIRAAVERLEKLVSESDELVERLRGTFSSVLLKEPQNGKAVGERDAFHGSDLGQALMVVADRLSGSLNAIREVIESSDV